MKETIIVAPGANGTELKKSLAMRGTPVFNLRIMNAAELARTAMMRSGIALTEDFISPREETALISEALKGEAYFRDPGLSDIEAVAAAVRRMRSLYTGEDEESGITEIVSKGIFKEKNDALASVCKKYIGLLRERHLLDRVTLIRRALSEAGPMDSDFLTLEEYPLSPLEEALLGKLSSGSREKTSLAALFNAEDPAVHIESIRNCYGASNETETVLSDIYRKRKLDECTVAVTDPTAYGQLFFDYALLYDIPVSFGCGIGIANSYPAALLSAYYHWKTDGFFSAGALRSMLSGKFFHRGELWKNCTEPLEDEKEKSLKSLILKLAGELRLTDNQAENEQRVKDFEEALKEDIRIEEEHNGKALSELKRKALCVPHLRVIGKELALPAEEFISKYAAIRPGSKTNAQKLLMDLDRAAVSAIADELTIARQTGLPVSEDDLIARVLSLRVLQSGSEAGKLYVTGVDGALAAVRENLYIVGLSARKYPGSPKEDYLLLDEDLKLFGEDAAYLTSEQVITQKRDRLLRLVRLASGLGSTVNVSYAGMNVSELKQDNPSSLIYELYREETGGAGTTKDLENRIEKVRYFDPEISATRGIGRAYAEGKKIGLSEAEEVKADRENDQKDSIFLKNSFSPSALGTFFNCPRAFMLQYLLGIRVTEEDKPFTVISGSDRGTLIHALMETLGDRKPAPDEFRERAGQYFDRYMKEHPALSRIAAEKAREQFLKLTDTALSMQQDRETVVKEEDLEKKHGTSGVTLRGFPDRVEKLDDGTRLIVDYKTGHTIEHIENDIDTCLQAVVYAFLVEEKYGTVSGGEFRYFAKGETVSCVYDDEMKQALDSKLKEFKEQLNQGDFPIPELAIHPDKKKGNPCKYCKFGLVCGKPRNQGEGDNDE